MAIRVPAHVSSNACIRIYFEYEVVRVFGGCREAAQVFSIVNLLQIVTPMGPLRSQRHSIWFSETIED